MINEHILIGIYGAGIMGIIGGLIILIKNKVSYPLIPNTLFGFVGGSVGSLLYNLIMSEVYPSQNILAISCLIFLGLGIFVTAIQLIIRGIKDKNG